MSDSSDREAEAMGESSQTPGDLAAARVGTMPVDGPRVRQHARLAVSVVEKRPARGRATGAQGGRRNMPNLLPNWSQTLPWGLGEFHLRVAGRMTWATLLFV